MPEDELLQGLITDLRRGMLVLAVLASLEQPKYGYALLQDMQAKGIRIEANTLYPLLRRLEAQGLLLSEWDTTESRPRKYYSVSARGRVLFDRLRAEWQQITQTMQALLGEDEPR
ncbi:MAG: PadR family transcriptional regulator [Coriobacteriales bacterium]|nr:PadR family transcriptional regulator [Coriobacteriales bacterium]